MQFRVKYTNLFNDSNINNSFQKTIVSNGKKTYSLTKKQTKKKGITTHASCNALYNRNLKGLI